LDRLKAAIPDLPDTIKVTKSTILSEAASYCLFLQRDGARLTNETIEELAKNLLLQNKLNSLRNVKSH
jgi:hypothetical protein